MVLPHAGPTSPQPQALPRGALFLHDSSPRPRAAHVLVSILSLGPRLLSRLRANEDEAQVTKQQEAAPEAAQHSQDRRAPVFATLLRSTPTL